MKKILIITSIFLSSIILVPRVNASETFYTNNLNVNMTEEQYNMLSTKVSEDIIANLSQEEFDSAISDLDNIEEEVIEMYVQTTYYTDPAGNEHYYEEEITEDEYENFNPIQPMSDCSTGAACWETNAKKVYLAIGSFPEEKSYMYILTNTWKSIPKVKSFDVIALRWNINGGNFTVTNYYGFQEYDSSSIRYAKGGDNSKATSDGVGISMNIVDSTSSSLLNQLVVHGYYTSYTDVVVAILYGTYQHATSNLTLSQSKSYSFSNSGLGNVLYYSNSTIRNAYDGMQGINYGLVIPLFRQATLA